MSIRERAFSGGGTGTKITLVLVQNGKKRKYLLGKMSCANLFGKTSKWKMTPHYGELLKLAEQNGVLKEPDKGLLLLGDMLNDARTARENGKAEEIKLRLFS